MNAVLHALWQTLYGRLAAFERSHTIGLIPIKQTTEIIVQHYNTAADTITRSFNVKVSAGVRA